MSAADVRVEAYFDCSSPNAYTAFHHLQQVAGRLGVQVLWKPILVGAVFNKVNAQIYAQREAMMGGEVPRKFDYSLKDFQDWARYLGIVLNFPPKCGHPVNSVRCMRACIALEPLGLMLSFAHAGFEALWVHGLDLARNETLIGICERAGADPKFVLEAIETAEIKTALRNNTDELMARNGFGTPTFFINGDDMYFGNDRIILVEAAIRRKLQDGRRA
jgi:2-hydroxychromene-2-carboxylate isomerase